MLVVSSPGLMSTRSAVRWACQLAKFGYPMVECSQVHQTH
ncbi:hypothetical protein I553_1013 [Mycobacterium xenopi 4042]|uniref:Uncharacterized protein n=1 Tax=Mycobacterium xenopi 4042 TaxID=1299334 RepID=X7ZB85_MYCXE|nr:hypothetical protein I553_1013 [Mycobacterium xenopi 4042]